MQNFSMQQKESTHRPSAQMAARLPTCIQGAREDKNTVVFSAPELMAVGVEIDGHESGPRSARWERLRISAPFHFCVVMHTAAVVSANLARSGGVWIYYYFSSWMGNFCVGLSQFWPMVLPVIRTQVFARDSATSCTLDGGASFQWDALFTSHPIRNNRWCYTHSLSNGERPPTLPVYPFSEFHQVIISHWFSICQ